MSLDPAAMFWIATVALLAHVLEEYPRFPAWATRHFGRTSRAWYVYSHLVLLVAVGLLSTRAQAAGPRSSWAVLVLAVQWILATNALFHVATTLVFREYSPGVMTGTFLVLPSTAYLYYRVSSLELVTTTQLASAIALGTVLSATAIASLWWRADFDWRFRRPSNETPPNEELKPTAGASSLVG